MEWTCIVCGRTIGVADQGPISAIAWRSTNGRYQCVSCVKHPLVRLQRAVPAAALPPALRVAARQRLIR